MIRRHWRFRIWVLIAAALSAVAVPAGAAQSSVPPAAVPGVQDAAGTVLIGNSLRLVVGRSMFINTKERLLRVYVSNPDVLNSMTASPNQIVVTAKAPGVSSLILWDESGRPHSWEITADMDVADLRAALRSALPGEDIHVEGREDQICLSGIVSSPAAMDQAVKLAGLYSKNVTNSLLLAPQHTPQVRLKVRIVEIDRSRAEQLGFNFFGTGKNTFNTTTGTYPATSVTSTTITTSSSTATTTGSPAQGILSIASLLNLFYYNNSLGLGAALQALVNKQIMQILAEPTLTTVSGQTASFLDGGQFPVPVVQGASSGFTAVTIEFRPYGVKLSFTPNVLPDGTIQLKVAPEVSALDYTNAVEVSGFTIPALDTRSANTEVELKSGQSFVISGLLDNRTTDELEKVPGIGDIPILGKLFQSKTSTHSVDELAVIVTPTLVNPLAGNPPTYQPKMVVPFLNDKNFDKHLGGGVVPKSDAPQLPTQPQPQ
jgi:pilus assembly protein CpaC